MPHAAPRPVTATSLPDPSNAPEIKVALLLPLSGKAEGLGKAMLDAAMLGLFDKYDSADPHAPIPRIQLIPRDTQGDAKIAARVAKEALDDGAQMILGPLYSSSVDAVAPIAKQYNVTMLSFSNNAEVASEHSFLFGFMPAEQVRRVVGEAFKAGDRRIAALLPANRYGNLLEEELKTYATITGIELVGIARYQPDAADIGAYVQPLVGLTTDGRPLTIDALLLGEGGERLEELARRLAQFRLSNKEVRYLGTGLWDNPSLRGTPSLIGSWFASSPPDGYQNFIARFEATHDYTPPRLASLGYDGVALLATLAAHGDMSPAALTNPHGYAGPANGIFRFRKNGTIERGLSVIAFTEDGFEAISPAPRLFYDE
ncbi:MAG: penicillin-binding protein activator [Sphaerospermopsis sp. SIO1G2]|nr:penicillin-binding protein activator [Sphaerospermopsis sp. SIO1G2]